MMDEEDYTAIVILACAVLIGIVIGGAIGLIVGYYGFNEQPTISCPSPRVCDVIEPVDCTKQILDDVNAAKKELRNAEILKISVENSLK